MIDALVGHRLELALGRLEPPGEVMDDVDADDRVALDQPSQRFGGDGADDGVVDGLGACLGQSILADQGHITEDGPLLVDVERQLLPVG